MTIVCIRNDDFLATPGYNNMFCSKRLRKAKLVIEVCEGLSEATRRCIKLHAVLLKYCWKEQLMILLVKLDIWSKRLISNIYLAQVLKRTLRLSFASNIYIVEKPWSESLTIWVQIKEKKCRKKKNNYKYFKNKELKEKS